MKNLLKILAWTIALWAYSLTLAWSVDHFDVKIDPSSVKVWESVDLTIQALDKNWSIVKDYVWEVLIFSQSDPKAEFPWVLKENSYTFKTSDAWMVKFENAVKFSQKWTQDINIYDVSNEDIFWYAEAVVWEWTSTATASGEINISYPESWTTLWTDSIKVSWKTQKNHKIKIILNTDKITNAISDSSWAFEVEIKNIPSWENSLKAQLLDADEKVISISSEVLFRIESNIPKLRTLVLDPNQEEFAPETVVNVSLEASEWLTDVNLILNDVVSKLIETSKAWTYTWTITTPKENWEYKIDVSLKSELWVESKENWVATINVKAPEMNAANSWSTNTWVTINCDDFKKELDIKNVKVVKMKSKSVLSWDKVDKASSYNVYKKDKTWTWMTLMENTTDNKFEIAIVWDTVEFDDFTIKAVFKDDVCDIEWESTEMTKVQTGPKELIFILALISLLTWVFLLRRKDA